MTERDLGARFDEHMAAEFVLHDADATMESMVDEPVVLHVPTSIGGQGREAVHRFYRDYFVDAFPSDFEVTNLSRTVGAERVVDEMIVSFTHSCEMPIFLPGVAPTGRTVRIPLVGVVAFVGDDVASEHLYWDQASVLVQVGLLDPVGVPVRGGEQAIALETVQIDNALISDW